MFAIKNTPEIKAVIQSILDWYGNDPAKWTQNTAARDRFGASVAVWDSDVCCMCLTASIHQASGESDRSVFVRSYLQQWATCFCAAEEIRYIGKWGGIIHYNDKPGRTFEEIINFLEHCRDADEAPEAPPFLPAYE